MADGSKTKLPRFAFDPDLKPAIVGSYSYDIVKGEFVVHPEANSSTTEINLTDIILSSSTNSPVTQDDVYRKILGISKPFKWRSRSSSPSRNSLLKGSKVSNPSSIKAE